MKTIASIAAELHGYDPQSLSTDEVHIFLSRLVSPVTQHENVGIFQALNRVLSHDLISPINVPPHDNSAMDGYAFDGAQLSASASLHLKVIGTTFAGKAWQGLVQTGECVRVMTGAIMPAGLNTVVPQEFVTCDDQTITVPPGLLHLGDNRRKLGEDLMQGHVALQKGERLTPAALGLLASLGISHIPVWRKLRVAYFSTGDEILSLGETPREGAVYDSNRYTVLGLLSRMGCEVIDMGVVLDDPALLEAAFVHAAASADAIITSGGVSVGEADYTRVMMKKLGDVAFWKIAMRPGRPMAVGHILKNKFPPDELDIGVQAEKKHSDDVPIESSVLFGLPGNPVAVMVTFLAFVRPALLQMMGNTAPPPPLLKARCLTPLRKKAGRTEYQRGLVCTMPDGSLGVTADANQGSGVLSSMVRCNGLLVLHHNQSDVCQGEEVDVMMFEGVI
jgi:molybdopterin molybdotransferase